MKSVATNIPIIIVSRIRNAIMYSRTRSCTLSQEARMQSGISTVASSTNNTEMPSTPTEYATLKSGSQVRRSVNW